MVTPALVQSKIYFGYAQAALRLGFSFQQYRATDAGNPISPEKLVATLPAAFVKTFEFSSPVKFGDAIWQALVDGRVTKTGDFFVGTGAVAGRTYYLAGMQPMLPILAVECNRVLTVLRTAPQDQQFGIGPYSGSTEATETPLMTAWPASVLEGAKITPTNDKLPDDARATTWKVLLPAFPGVTLQFNDIITDDLGRRGIVSSAELTELGWRILAAEEEI